MSFKELEANAEWMPQSKGGCWAASSELRKGPGDRRAEGRRQQGPNSSFLPVGVQDLLCGCSGTCDGPKRVTLSASCPCNPDAP